MSNAERVVEFFDAAVPKLRSAWAGCIREGREAYTKGLPRQAPYRRRSHRRLWETGWDRAKKESDGIVTMPDETIVGIDPGETKSASLVYVPARQQLADCQIVDNALLAVHLRCAMGTDCLLAIEDMDSYGMPVGKSTMETLKWIGRFQECWRGKTVEITRRNVKLHLCGTVRAKDANVRQALIDRFGGIRQVAIGTKKKPGPLYGIKTHLWSALAVAVTAAETK